MTLTEEERKKIEEQEAYRVEIKGNPNKKKNIGCFGIIGILFVVSIVFLIVISAINPSRQLEKAKQAQSESVIPTQSTQIEFAKGEYLDYQYIILNQKEEQTYTATFTPFLPRDDTVVIGAMLTVINQTFGKNTIKNLTPQTIEQDGKNLILFTGIEQNYYFLLVKKDTGEVQSFIFWAE